MSPELSFASSLPSFKIFAQLFSLSFSFIVIACLKCISLSSLSHKKQCNFEQLEDLLCFLYPISSVVVVAKVIFLALSNLVLFKSNLQLWWYFFLKCRLYPHLRLVYEDQHEQRVYFTGHGSQVTGHRSRVTGHGSRVTGHGSRVRGHGSQVTCHGSRITGHRSQVTGHGSQVTGHRSRVTGHRSRVTGHGSQVADHRSRFIHTVQTKMFTLYTLGKIIELF
jgi:hypothetical protein